MTLRAMWRELRERRRLVVLVVVLAGLVGLAVAFRPGLPPESREYKVWIASTDILIDTSDTQVVDARGPDPVTLANRAGLLGNVIATEELITAIGTAAGVPPDQLSVVPPAPPTDGIPVSPPPVRVGGDRKVRDSEATVLTLSTDETVPILHVSAQAPDASTAGRLTSATLGQLKQHLDAITAEQSGRAIHKLVVRQLGVRPPVPQIRGTSAKLGLVAAVMIALLGCLAIVAMPMLALRWRQAETAERELEPTDPDGEPAIQIDRAAHREQAHEGRAELATAAISAGPAALPERAEGPNQRKKQPRRRRKHGRAR